MTSRPPGWLSTGMAKAAWADGFLGVRDSRELTSQLARIHAVTHLERDKTSMARDDVQIDSPTTTTNHYHPPSSPWPWIAGAVVLVALVIAWATIGTQPRPAPQPPAAQKPFPPIPGYGVKIYEP